MLSQEVAKESVKVIYKGTEVTSQVIDSLIRLYLKYKQEQKAEKKTGEKSIKELNKTEKKLESITIAQEDLRGLKRELKKFGIDFAVVKNQKDNTYEIYFKGSNINQIKHSLENYLAQRLKIEKKPSIKEKIRLAKEKVKNLKRDQINQIKKLESRDER